MYVYLSTFVYLRDPKAHQQEGLIGFFVIKSLCEYIINSILFVRKTFPKIFKPKIKYKNLLNLLTVVLDKMFEGLY